MPPEVTTSGGGSGGGGGGGGGEGGGGGGGSGSGGGCDWEEEELRCCCSSSQDGQSGPFPCLHRPLLADLARNARMAPRFMGTCCVVARLRCCFCCCSFSRFRCCSFSRCSTVWASTRESHILVISAVQNGHLETFSAQVLQMGAATLQRHGERCTSRRCSTQMTHSPSSAAAEGGEVVVNLSLLHALFMVPVAHAILSRGFEREGSSSHCKRRLKKSGQDINLSLSKNKFDLRYASLQNCSSQENAENTPHSPRRRGTTQILTTTGTLYPRSCTPGSTRFSNHEVDSNRHDFGRCDLSGSRQPPAARRVGSFRCYHGRAARRLDTNRICGWRTGMASRYQCPAAPEAGIT
jgi:hypothetical protein